MLLVPSDAVYGRNTMEQVLVEARVVRITIFALGGMGAALGTLRGIFMVTFYILSGVSFGDLFTSVTLVLAVSETAALLFSVLGLIGACRVLLRWGSAGAYLMLVAALGILGSFIVSDLLSYLALPEPVRAEAGSFSVSFWIVVLVPAALLFAAGILRLFTNTPQRA